MNLEFSKETLHEIDKADDLKIAPFRADGVTYGTPTWIWNVVVDGGLYVRAYNGIHSSWYQSALAQKAGMIHAAGNAIEVAFEPVKGGMNDKIDKAYQEKYHNSPYLAPMINQRAKAATVRISPVNK